MSPNIQALLFGKGDSLVGKRAPELRGITGYINTDGFSISDYTDKKPVLLEFWSYGCGNCQNAIPHLRDWHYRYGDRLAVIGVHTLETEAEKDYSGVKAAVEKYGIPYPVALDNSYETWRAYGNLYWPTIYLIGRNGSVSYVSIGDGNYEETESMIREAAGE